MYYAHSENRDGAGSREMLADHLRFVSKRAARYASVFGAREQAAMAGLLHDLGKYADQFQRRLDDPRHERGRDHWSSGAALAACCYKSLGIVPALAIEGHHAGLRMLSPWKEFASKFVAPTKSEAEAFTDADISRLKSRFDRDRLALPKLADGLVPSGDDAPADMLDVRMFFSTLVDADFVETEAHFAGNADSPRRYRDEGPPLDPARALDAVQSRIGELTRESKADRSVQGMRTALVEACLTAAARHQPGVFTLSAPTGSGKTLAMLTFAIRHAMEHDLRRVIVVMPFLSIIDQTKSEYCELFSRANGFPSQFVIEDHSNVNSHRDGSKDAAADSIDPDARLHRLLAENWDAPVVLTTTVQCLESLMSNRPSACRKLHRLAKSVILFDEVQTLPGHLAVPTLATLSRLVERFGSTVVFSTATQPAFDHLDQYVRPQAQAGWRATEIVPNPSDLFEPTAGRVRVRWQHDHVLPWGELCDQLVDDDQPQALCILNLKRHARKVAEILRERETDGCLHLSTNMCMSHRMKVLAEVTRKLKGSDPVRLIATQCVEAGVDLDFPVVYRAFAPLESIAQAAGRCNRHGRRDAPGIVHVFKPESDGRPTCPPGAYQDATNATEVFLRGLSADPMALDDLSILSDPDRLRAYFRQLYTLTAIETKNAELRQAIEECDFVKVARHYKLIDDTSINILVRYHDETFDSLVAETELPEFHNPKAIREWIRRARPHAVSLFRPKSDSPVWRHIDPVQWSSRRERDDSEATWFTALPGGEYDDELLGWIGGDDSCFS